MKKRRPKPVIRVVKKPVYTSTLTLPAGGFTAYTLEQNMERLRGRHTYGAHGPILFLLHADDVRYLRKAYGPEMRNWYGWKSRMAFHGILVKTSKLAEKGEPLAVVRNPV